MWLVTFEKAGRDRAGALLDGLVVDLAKAARETGRALWPQDIDVLTLLREDALEAARQVVSDLEGFLRAGEKDGLLTRGAVCPLESVRLRAPVPNASKVVAIGLNYRDHALEQGSAIPDRPLIFAKFPTSITGPGDVISWDPGLTGEVDYEAELAFVIGKKARNVPQEKAYEHVAGYACLNDVSARDLQFGDRQWVRGKSLDTFCPFGPFLATTDEVPDPHKLSIRSTLNGTVMQDSNTSELIFGVPELVAFISRAFTLLPGDVVATGTPAGVGVFRKPPVFLKSGDRIAIEIQGLGRLENVCRTL